MRVALVNEGTYPYVTGGVSTWCDQLVRGLAEVTWHLVTIVGTRPAGAAVALPDNVASLTPLPVWGAPQPPRRPATDAAVQLCRGMLGDSPGALAVFADALRELALPDGRYANAPTRRRRSVGRHPLFGAPLADILLDAWAAARGTLSRPLPPLTLADADEAAVLIEHATRPLAAVLPAVDVCHANANGLSALVALGAKWRAGVPFAMTEHGVYLRERYLASAGQAPAVKVAVLRFHRALARLAYAEADLVAPVTAFNRRWEVRNGADPGKVVVIPNGVDPQRFPPLPDEPETPTIAWVGRVDPLKDLETLIRALALVRAEIPAARLHLAGPVPRGNEEYARTCAALVAELGLGDSVTFAGPVATSREAFAAGQLVALSSISEGMPYTVIEAMMCGRATVSTDVGGVAEVVDDTGIVVPPGDPAAFAAACVALLRDPGLRRNLAARGRARALAHYTLSRCLDAYRRRYAELTPGLAA
jgi:glycosyltransferase involved in cell wall biosynthesis